MVGLYHHSRSFVKHIMVCTLQHRALENICEIILIYMITFNTN